MDARVLVRVRESDAERPVGPLRAGTPPVTDAVYEPRDRPVESLTASLPVEG